MDRMSWTIFAPSFLTAAVEWVEAFTIVLAVSLTIGWPAALGAAAAALATLAALTAATGGVLQLGVGISWLQFIIGIFLLLFGVRWLAKAIARQAGLRALHDEDEEFAATRALLSSGDGRAAWLIAYKGVLLEGLEVWLVVVALSVGRSGWASSVGGAVVALVMVVLAGAYLRSPLSRVPENAIKFGVGAMIVSFGTFWSLEAIGGADIWPMADWSLVGLVAFYVVGGLLLSTALRPRLVRGVAK
jgi:Ca2+/H+ antiporter, TMEM165/GDT1 family